MSDTLITSFLDTLGTFPMGEDAYPVELVAHLDGADRDRVEAALISRVREHDDAKAARSLAKLGMTGATQAVSELVGRLEAGAQRDLAAVALLGLGAPGALDGVLAVLRKGSDTGKTAALLALHDQPPSPTLVDAVLGLFLDPDAILRGMAYDAWVRLVGIAPLQLRASQKRNEPRSPLRTLHMQLLSGLPTLYAQAEAQARDLTAALRGGAHPDTLDLVYQASTPDSERLTLASPDAALDLEALQAWSGHDRRWLEVLLCLRGEPDHRDPRAPDALAALGAGWTAAILEDTVEGMMGDHPYAVAVAKALPRLWALE